MSTFMILGPALDRFTEPEPGAAPEGLAGISFGEPAVLPRGRVRFAVEQGEGRKRPVNVYAFFVPADREVDRDTLTPDFFFSGAFANGSVGIVPDRHEYEVRAAGVKPGAYFVQTVLEYASN